MFKKILAVILAAIDAGLLALIIVGAVSANKAEGSPDPDKPGTVVTDKVTEPVTEIPTTEPPATEPPATEPPATEPPATEPPATEPPATEPPETEPPATEAPASEFPDSKKMSTSDCPQEGDLEGLDISEEGKFVWSGLSDKAVRISSFKAVRGGWKCYMIDNLYSEDGSDVYFCNVEISGTEEETAVTLHWMYWYDELSGIEEDDVEDYVFSGKWSGGRINASGDYASVEIRSFRLDGEREFAVGRMEWGDGAVGIFALVRP